MHSIMSGRDRIQHTSKRNSLEQNLRTIDSLNPSLQAFCWAPFSILIYREKDEVSEFEQKAGQVGRKRHGEGCAQRASPLRRAMICTSNCPSRLCILCYPYHSDLSLFR